MSKTVREFNIRESTIRGFIKSLNNVKENDEDPTCSEIKIDSYHSSLISKSKTDITRKSYTLAIKQQVEKYLFFIFNSYSINLKIKFKRLLNIIIKMDVIWLKL